jgi:hypothetical protein
MQERSGSEAISEQIEFTICMQTLGPHCYGYESSKIAIDKDYTDADRHIRPSSVSQTPFYCILQILTGA